MEAYRSGCGPAMTWQVLQHRIRSPTCSCFSSYHTEDAVDDIDSSLGPTMRDEVYAMRSRSRLALPPLLPAQNPAAAIHLLAAADFSKNLIYLGLIAVSPEPVGFTCLSIYLLT